MFKVGDKVKHRAKHADCMHGTVVRMGETPVSVFVRRDKDGNVGCYMEAELQRAGSDLKSEVERGL